MNPTPQQVKRWRQYLANERAEAAVYRELAQRKEGEEREILLAVAEAEARHEEHWRHMLGDQVGMPRTPDLSTRFLGFLARRFGTVVALAMMQTAESRTPYYKDADVPEQIKADEAIHAEVVRGLAARGREQMSGTFRAAVFGANDGLVSNLALVLGVLASGVDPKIVLLTGLSGMLSGALSMAVGEYISVRSQSELLEASNPHKHAGGRIGELDVDANELALVYRARGMAAAQAELKAAEVFQRLEQVGQSDLGVTRTEVDHKGAWSAAVSSFLFFGVGALIPVVPFFFGLSTLATGVIATILVGVALMCTGAITGVLSGKRPGPRAARQLLLGYGAAIVTILLGLMFGTVVG